MCASAIAENRLNPKAIRLMGSIKLSKWYTSLALKNLTTIASSGQDAIEAYVLLSSTLKKGGRPEEAAEWAKRAIECRPEDPSGFHLIGLCYLDLSRYEEAESAFRQAVSLDSTRAEYHDALGTALRKRGFGRRSIEAFRMAVELAPTDLSYLVHLCEALIDELDMPEAEECARRLIGLAPEAAVGHQLLALTLITESQTAEAEAEARLAAKIEPDNGAVAATFGAILQVLGKMDEANRINLQAIELDPFQGLPYFSLIQTRKVGQSDLAIVEQMTTLLESEDLDSAHRGFLNYGLGKAFEDLKEFDLSMRHYDEANRLAYLDKFGDMPFDKGEHRERYRLTHENYDQAFFSDGAEAGVEDDTPIFVVGMIRSGTTLIEQILSTHSDVGAAGEQRFWPRNKTKAIRSVDGTLDSEALRRLAQEYLGTLRKVSPDTRHVVDKMPVNYMNLGLMTLAFPNSKIIHMRRHPIDTCISVYATQNRVRLQWSHHKDHIAFNYELYDELMAHWRQTLPPGRMLEVQYEELVSNQEATTRRVLEFCGLSWTDACLQPERNDRGVSTPSLWQVRQPVNRNSVQRWKKFEPWLGEFARLHTRALA
jgi:tetratricopeptide (TPR) repeat protein